VSTTLAIRFPLGRYHANPWDRAVNEGATEWPPSPWRILRALVATWHTRWPELSASVLDGLLESLDGPPSYRTPPVLPSHTRHYLPDLEHRKGEPGRTDLTLDPFLSVSRNDSLFVRWDADLDAERRAVLAKLVELLPYLGRSESVCEARLLDEETVPDEHWWRPGPGPTRLLAVTRPVSRAALEATTADVRKRRRTMPPGTTWVSYAEGKQPGGKTMRLAGGLAQPPTAVRFAVTGRVPMKTAHGVLLADEAHRLAGKALERDGIADERRRAILGTRGAGTDHRHAHWIVLPEPGEQGAYVRYLIVYVPQGLETDELRAMLSLRKLSGKRGGGGDAYEVRGFPPVELLFQAAGPVEQVAPELYGPARRWRSHTPYLPVRHRKREPLDAHLAADVHTELGYRPRYRDLPSLVISRMEPDSGMPDRWARDFRRYRMTEDMSKSRAGLGLQLEFAEPVAGPLLLGKLSHFGYGIFIPDTT
jgi:CRISPR-associated protein Csb2